MHVYQRFTSSLDPGHLHPWHYYLGEMFAFWECGALVLTAGACARWRLGGRRYAPSFLVLVIWLLLPLAAISVVTSKLYHYAFPFLPALALDGRVLLRRSCRPSDGRRSTVRWIGRTHARRRERLD